MSQIKKNVFEVNLTERHNKVYIIYYYCYYFSKCFYTVLTSFHLCAFQKTEPVFHLSRLSDDWYNVCDNWPDKTALRTKGQTPADVQYTATFYCISLPILYLPKNSWNFKSHIQTPCPPLVCCQHHNTMWSLLQIIIFWTSSTFIDLPCSYPFLHK